MTTITVDNAHRPSITPNAMPTLCPTLVAEGGLISVGKLEDDMAKELVLLVGGMENVVG